MILQNESPSEVSRQSNRSARYGDDDDDQRTASRVSVIVSLTPANKAINCANRSTWKALGLLELGAVIRGFFGNIGLHIAERVMRIRQQCRRFMFSEPFKMFKPKC